MIAQVVAWPSVVEATAIRRSQEGWVRHGTPRSMHPGTVDGIHTKVKQGVSAWDKGRTYRYLLGKYLCKNVLISRMLYLFRLYHPIVRLVVPGNKPVR